MHLTDEQMLTLTDQDYDEIYARFDFNDDGSVHYDELLMGLRVCDIQL